MISYFIFIFWDVVIYVRKTKYDFNKTHAIKAKYKLLVIASIYNFVWSGTLFYNIFVCFWDTVIYVIKAKYEK